MGGSFVFLVEVEDFVDVIFWVWYLGEEGGNVVADFIFGLILFFGRFFIIFFKFLDQLLFYEDYGMIGWIYCYMKEELFYLFGYGLSYMIFEYEFIIVGFKNLSSGDCIIVFVIVSNIG